MSSADNHYKQFGPRQSVGPDLDPNCLTLIVYPKESSKKVDFENNQQTTKKHEKLPSRQRVKENVYCNIPLPM